MKLFHGTTADKLQNILSEGFRTSAGGENWTVSDEFVYFWSPDRLAEAGECEFDCAESLAISNAISSGTVGLGFASDCRVVVFEVELPEEGMEDDQSCENMTGAVRTFRDVPPEAIKGITISQDWSLMKGFFLSHHLNREHSARELSPMERKIGEFMASLELYPEEEMEMRPFEK